jgi:hypothetical protein
MKETVKFVQGLHFTSHLFEGAMDMRTREVIGTSEAAAWGTLFRWAFKAGQHPSGTFESIDAPVALVVAAAWEEESLWPKWLLAETAKRLAKDDFPLQQRTKIAAELRKRIGSRGRGGLSLSVVDSALGRVDRKRYNDLLAAVANLFAPVDATGAKVSA